MHDAPAGTGAVLEVRMLTWRPERRRLDPDDLRQAPADLLGSSDDLAGLLLGLGIWLAIVLLAPVTAIVLAVLLVNLVSGDTRRERYRNGLHALRRIRSVNQDRRVLVRWRRS